MRRLTTNDLRRIIKEEMNPGRRPLPRNTLASVMYGRTLKEEVDWDAQYEAFVTSLSQKAADPKVLAVIQAGNKDGNADDDKFTMTKTDLEVELLRPTQNEIDVDKSLGYPLGNFETFKKFAEGTGKSFTLKSPIITFNGQYVIDGHHRWSQVYACNPKAKISAIDLKHPNLDPIEVLKAVQGAIAASSNKVETQAVEGMNLLKIDRTSFEAWMSKAVNLSFYGNLGADDGLMDILRSASVSMNEVEVSQEKFKEAQDLLLNYLWSNTKVMQTKSQPVDGASPRDFMPQTDSSPDFVDYLIKGDIDIAEPHGPAAESRTRRDSLVMERWQKLAGIIKG